MLLLVVLFCTKTETNAQDFNKWSIDLGVGIHKPVFPFTLGYGTANPDFWLASVGGRYMTNEKFGLRLDLGYNKFTDSDVSQPFETSYYRATIEAVVNAGELLGFRNWTQGFNVLIHGGLGMSDIKYTVPNTPNDQVMNALIGITPQVKLSDRVALFLDVGAIVHLYQDISFDGNSRTSRIGFNGGMFTASIGLNIYLGEHDTHADWYTKPDYEEEEGVTENNGLKSVKKRLKVVETEIDRLAGIQIDYDKDALISELDTRYYKKGDIINPITKVNFIKELLNQGYQNVYFDFGKSSIQKHSLETVNYLRTYMSENPSATAEIIGYADELGNASSNQTLSTERAKRVYDVLIASGISSNRLSYSGKGEDASVDKNSADARQLVRRVTFTIK